MADTFLLAALFLIVGLVIFNRGIFSTDAIFVTGVVMWHVPLLILVRVPNALSGNLAYLTASYNLDRYADVVLYACIAAVLGFWFGGHLKHRLASRRRRTHMTVMRSWTQRVNYRYLFVTLWFFALVLNASAYFRRAATNYAAQIGGGAALIHPVMDWFFIYSYLVILLFFLVKFSAQPFAKESKPSYGKLVLAFVPLIPLFLSGSRQAFMGPIMALIILMLPLDRRNKLRFSILFVVLISVLPALSNAVRVARVEAGGSALWTTADGFTGFLFEMSRTVRLVGWAMDVCSQINLDPLAYISEALGRLVLMGGNIENLSILVGRGGGNGFSFVTEAVCVAGPENVVSWSLIYGLLLGFLFSIRLGAHSDMREKFLFAFYLSVAVMWPRDEILGYIREAVWFGILATLVFFRSQRISNRGGPSFSDSLPPK